MSNNNINTPDGLIPFDPNNPVHRDLVKLSGDKQQHHWNLVEGAKKLLGFQEHQMSDMELLLAKGRKVIDDVRTYATFVADAHIDNAQKLDTQKLAEEVMKKYLEAFGSCTKDELLLYLCRFLGEQTMREVV